MTKSSRSTPCFTLPLARFDGLSAATRAALDDLAAPRQSHGIQALALRPKNTANCTEPSETGFFFEDGTRTVLASGFKSPGHVLGAGAAAAYMVSHDPALDRLFSAMSLVARTCRHDRFLVTSQACLSWRTGARLAGRGKDAEYQDRLNQGDAIYGYVTGKGPVSAHERLEIQAQLGGLAEKLYAWMIEDLSQRGRTGLYRRVTFQVAAQLTRP